MASLNETTLIVGDAGANDLAGGPGDDALHGDAGDDTLRGLLGADTLIGGLGDDLLIGGPGRDVLYGGAGDDTLICGDPDRDGALTRLFGNDGFDTLSFQFAEEDYLAPGVIEEIADYAAQLSAGALVDPDREFVFLTFGLRAAGFEAMEIFVDGVLIEPGEIPAIRVFPDSFSTLENVVLNGDLSLNDILPDDAVVSLLGGVGAGQLALLPSGAFSFDPLDAFRELSAGETTDTNFTYQVTDGDRTSIATATITVTGVNEAPTGGEVALVVTENLSGGGNVIADSGATDIDALDILSVASVDGVEVAGLTTVTLASGATVTISPDGDYRYDTGDAFDALANQAMGADVFEVVIADGEGGFATSTVTIEIIGQNDSPIVTGELFLVDQGEDVLANLLDNDFDVDLGDSLSVSGFVDPGLGGILNIAADGELSFIQEGAFDFLALGESLDIDIAYTVRDTLGGAAVATATITVFGLNDGPTASNIALATDEDSATGGDFIVDSGAFDTDDSDVLTVSAIDGVDLAGANSRTLASGAVLTIDAAGGFTYDPLGAFDFLVDAEPSGDAFTFTLADGAGGFVTASATIDLTGVNDPPVAVADEVSTDQASSVEIEVLSNDFDRDGPFFLVGFDDAPAAGGSVGSNQLGDVLFFSPDGDFDGLGLGESADVTFGYQIEDDDGAAADGVVTVTVEGLNDDPVAASLTVSATEDGGATGNILDDAGVFDIDLNDVVTVSAINGFALTGPGPFPLPSGALLTVSADGEFFYDTNGAFEALGLGQFAFDDFGYAVSDGQGGFDFESVSIEIQGQNDAPVAVADVATTDEETATQIDLLANDFDPDTGDTLTLQIDATAGSFGFADAVLDFQFVGGGAPGDPAEALGAGDGAFVSLPTGSSITLAFLDEIITDGVGDDLFIGEFGPGGEFATIEVSADGFNFEEIGVAANNTTTSFDLASIGFTGQLAAVRVTGLDSGGSSPGFDLDFVQAIGTAVTGLRGDIADLGGGVISYDPSGDFDFLGVNASAQETITYLVSDQNGETTLGQAVVTVTGVNDDPITTALNATTDEDQPAFTFDLLQSQIDPDLGDVLSVENFTQLGAQFAGFTISGGIFIFDATVFDGLAAGQQEVVSYSYDVVDPFGGRTLNTFTLTVLGRDEVINLDAVDDDFFVGQNGTLNDDVSLNDITSGGIFTLVADVTRGALDFGDDGSFTFLTLGDFDDAPAGGSLTETFRYRIDQGGGVDFATATITISGANDDPVAADAFDDTDEDTLLSGDFFALAGAFDPDTGDTLRVTEVNNVAMPISGQLQLTLGSGAQFTINDDGTYIYDPRVELGLLSVGDSAEEMITIVVSDDLDASVTRTLTIDVAGVNDAPEAFEIDTFTDEDNTVSGDLLFDASAFDVDQNDDLFISQLDGFEFDDTVIVELFSGALVTVDPTGGFTYDPNGLFEDLGQDAFPAFDSITYLISDGNGGEFENTVFIDVFGVNDDPTADPISISVTEDAAEVGNLIDDSFADDVDIGDVLSIALINGNGITFDIPFEIDSGALLTVSENGDFIYDPRGAFDDLEQDDETDDGFEFTITDQFGGAVTQTVDVRVFGINDLPVLIGAELQSVQLVSVSEDGLSGGDSVSLRSFIAGDGDAVTYFSLASNLVAGDTNVRGDVFVTDTTEFDSQRANLIDGGASQSITNGALNSRISADGQFVVFQSRSSDLTAGDVNNQIDIFLRDLATDETVLISQGFDGAPAISDSFNASISADGRFVVYESDASNLVGEDDNGSVTDIFLFDRLTGVTTLVEVDGVANNLPARLANISADGSTIVFQTGRDLVDPGDGNGREDIYAYDVKTGAVSLISVSSAGVVGALGAGDGADPRPAGISANGRYVAFVSSSNNLVAGDNNAVEDVFVHDRVTGVTELVSVSTSGVLGDAASFNANISGDGRFVTFESSATNLDEANPDTNGANDIFLHDRATGETTRVSVTPDGDFQPGGAQPSISFDGSKISFTSSLAEGVFDPRVNLPAVDDIYLADISNAGFSFGARDGLVDLDLSDFVFDAEGDVLDFDNLQIDSDTGRDVSFSLDGPTGVLSIDAGQFADLPQFNFEILTISFDATDSSGQPSALTLTASVRGERILPEANPDQFTIDEDTVLPGDVFANDVPAGGVATLIDGPALGELELDPDGGFSFDPTVDFNNLANGEEGTASFTYQIVVEASIQIGAGGLIDLADVGAAGGVDGFNLRGSNGDDRLGSAVTNVGDVNNDGIDDVLISAPNGDPSGAAEAGVSYVVFGRSGGFLPNVDVVELSGSDGFRIEGGAAADFAGGAAAAAGDVNGDGIDDILIGAASAAAEGGPVRGAAYVVFGRDGGFFPNVDLGVLDGTDGFRIESIENAQQGGNNFGAAVSGLGDVNGDGIDDVVVGHAAFTSDRTDASTFGVGAAVVVFGSSTGFSAVVDADNFDGSNGFVAIGDGAGYNAGTTVSGAGDVNGDGFADILIGAQNGTEGAAILLYGGATVGAGGALSLGALGSSDGVIFSALAGNDRLASGKTGLSGAGDVNGDGLDDFILSAFDADGLGRNNSGESYVIFGAAPGLLPTSLAALDGSNGFRIAGAAAYDRSGFAVSSAGDVNGDGFDDLIIGAFDASVGGATDAGRAFVVFGRGSAFDPVIDLGALSGADGFAIDGVLAGDRAGYAVSGAGDLNGDGIDDLIVGASLVDIPGEIQAGAGYVIFGSADRIADTSEIVTVDLTVTGVNDAPVGVEETFAVAAGALATGAVTADDPEDDDLLFTAVSPPPPGAFSLASDGSFTYTPDALAAGSFDLQVQADDQNGGFDVFTVTFDVNGIPIAGDSGGSLVALALQTNAIATDIFFTDPEGGALEYTANEIGEPDLPAGLIIDENTGVISGSPNGSADGLYRIEITATDGFGGAASVTTWLSIVDSRIEGTAVGETLTGDGDANFFAGFGGGDNLNGGAGFDVFLVTDGEGFDRITDNGAGQAEAVIFQDVAANEVSLRRFGDDFDDLVVTKLGEEYDFASGFLFVDALDTAANRRLDSLNFDDGARLFTQDMRQIILGQEATSGADLIQAFNSADTLGGGAGDDTLIGRAGADLYLYAAGGGADVIEDNGFGSADILRISGYNIADATFSVGIDNSDLTIDFGSGNSVTILNTLNAENNDEISAIEFDDGRISTREIGDATDVEPVLLDRLIAQQITTGDDTVTGFNLANVLEAGQGDDRLVGLRGNDTYIYRIGDGVDEIEDNGFGAGDVLEIYGFEIDIDLNTNIVQPGSQVTFSRAVDQPADLIISLNNNDTLNPQTGEIRIIDGLQSSSSDTIETISFPDQTGQPISVDISGVRQDLIAQQISTGADIVLGFAASDTIAAGAGDDFVNGAGGGDTYIYLAGDGRLTIDDGSTATSERLIFDDLLFSQLRFERSSRTDGNDLLIFNTGDLTDLVIVRGGVGTGQRKIETFEDSSGNTLTAADIRAQILLQERNEGADLLLGFDGADEMLTTAGRDATLKGGGGADTYTYRLGEGRDVIIDTSTATNETLTFVGINSTDFAADGSPPEYDALLNSIRTSDVVFDFGGGDRLTLHRFDTFELIEFDDLSFDRDADDTDGALNFTTSFLDVYATTIPDIALGAAGAAGSATSTAADEAFIGGGGGTDTVNFTPGAIGDDIITQNILSDVDINITALTADVEFARSPAGSNDLLITVKETGQEAETITLVRGLAGGGSLNTVNISRAVAVETLTAQQVAQRITNDALTEGDDSIEGFDFSLDITGGEGDDYLSGGSQNDIYRFAAGDGRDRIKDGGLNGDDQLIITGYTLAQATLRPDPGDENDLIIDFGADRITIVGGLSLGAFSVIERITFDSGEVTDNQLLATYVARQLADTSAPKVLGTADNDVITDPGGRYLEGRGGADTYTLTSASAGDTVILDNSFGTAEVLNLPVALAGATFAQAADAPEDLVITYTATGNTVRVIGGFDDSPFRNIETFEFTDQTQTVEQIRALTLSQAGTAADDTIRGSAVEDIIEGRAGDDYLLGREKSDLYLYAAGDGDDTIDDNGLDDADVLEIDNFVFNQLTFSRAETDPDDLLISFDGQPGSIRIVNQLIEPRFGFIETIRLVDSGQVIDVATARQQVIAGDVDAGDNRVIGFSGVGDTLFGAQGADTLSGLAGDDQYVFTAGDEFAYIDDNGAAGDADSLTFNGFASTDVDFFILTAAGSDLLVRSLINDDQVVVDGAFEGGGDAISSFEFSDTVLTLTEVETAAVANGPASDML